MVLKESLSGFSLGGGLLGFMFAGYVPLASQSPYPIKVYFLANYIPHLKHFLENVIFGPDPNLVTFFLYIYLINVHGFNWWRNVMWSM